MSLLRAREAVMRCFRPPLREHDLTEQQWRVLRALATVDGLEAREVARQTFLLAPSLSRILTDLERRGLVRRGDHASDRRRAVISISRAGTELIEAVTPKAEAVYRDIAARYGVEKLAILQGLLAELEAALDGHASEGAVVKSARRRPGRQDG